jgi:hypothetical protein
VRRYFQGNLFVTHALALMLIVACLLLSRWQWERAHYSRQAQAVAAPIAFEKLSKARDFLPPSSVGQMTQVHGTWQPGSRILLPNRPIDGRKLLASAKHSAQPQLGNWVVDFLTLKDGTSVAVIRGWQSSGNNFPSASGSANVRGIVQSAEDAPNSEAIVASPLITTKFLLGSSKTDIRDGFIVQTDVDGALVQVTPSRRAFTKDGLRTLNVFYTFNWIFFAFLISLIWIRIVRDEVSSVN